MVFPEGQKGTAKLYKERYSLVDFGTGFVRLALKTKTPIVPLGFVGGGDAALARRHGPGCAPGFRCGQRDMRRLRGRRSGISVCGNAAGRRDQ